LELITLLSDCNDKKPKTLEEAGVYLFMEDFCRSSCASAIRFVLEKNLLPQSIRPDYLTFVINSPGGDVNSCFALIDTMRGSAIPVYTVGIGLIASAGLNLFMAGAKGHRLITPNTSILSHTFSWGSYGKSHELFAAVKEFDLTQKRILEHYKKCTGLTEKKIKEKLLPPEDIWLDAEEAVDLGIADKIVTSY
jgi:ATP-dependent Clp protease protease subunit